MRVTLLLGSNLGRRSCNLDSALRRLEKAIGSPAVAFTPAVRTEACGFDGPWFLNRIVCFETETDPRQLLGICKEIERGMGRTDAPEYAADGARIYHNRKIDIDILFYGDLSIDEEDLKIPHPQVESRPFVKELLLSLQD